MRRWAAPLVAALLLSPLASATAAPAHAFAEIQRWSQAVLSHEAGSSDNAVRWLSRWEPHTFAQLFPEMVLVAARASDRERRLDTCGVSQSEKASRLWTTLVEKARRSVDETERQRLETFADQVPLSCSASFIVRAVALHTDTAVFFPYAGTTATTDTLRAPSAEKPDASMLRSPAMAIASDGRYARTSSVLPLWDSARQLLMGVPPDPARSAFVREWYAAVGAELRRQSNFAAARAHLKAWTALFPQDERLVFDTAQFQEALASPLVQAEIASAVEALRAAARTSTRLTPNDDPSRRGNRDTTRSATVCSYAPCEDGRPFGVGSASDHLAEAERLFQKVPATSPAFEEATVRRGRILARLGRYEASIGVLRTEHVRPPINEVNAYYRELFLGSSLEALGRVSDAREAYSNAIRLFPRSRSANLAMASLLSASGESATTLTFVAAAALDEPSDGRDLSSREPETLDPFDVYEIGRGRDAPELLRNLWSHVRTGEWR